METAHYPYISRAQREAAARYVESHFQARTILHRAGVWELSWTGSPKRSSVVLP
jgi:hypothetical protein